jgi:hypothetical protein
MIVMCPVVSMRTTRQQAPRWDCPDLSGTCGTESPQLRRHLVPDVACAAELCIRHIPQVAERSNGKLAGICDRAETCDPAHDTAVAEGQHFKWRAVGKRRNLWPYSIKSDQSGSPLLVAAKLLEDLACARRSDTEPHRDFCVSLATFPESDDGGDSLGQRFAHDWGTFRLITQRPGSFASASRLLNFSSADRRERI